MKRIVILFISLSILLGISIYAAPFLKEKTLNAREVKEKWGSEKLDFKKFKDGNQIQKAQMAFEILKEKTLIGKPINFIRENFGPPDGFFFIDTYPAYIIQEGNSHSEETWQIVFKLNEKHQVREVIVPKNCCA